MNNGTRKTYVDTSVLVAYYCPELLSRQVESVFIKRSDLVISWLVELEFVSAISQKVRRRELKEIDGTKIIGQFYSHLEQEVFENIAIMRQHYRLTRDWLGQFKMITRTLDALHLAVAQIERCHFITADAQQAKAAKMVGLKTIQIK